MSLKQILRNNKTTFLGAIQIVIGLCILGISVKLLVEGKITEAVFFVLLSTFGTLITSGFGFILAKDGDK